MLPVLLFSAAAFIIVSVVIASQTEPERPDRPKFKQDVAPGTPVTIEGDAIVLGGGAGMVTIGLTLPSTGYSRIDKILGPLKKASDSSGIPLGVLVGWVAMESGGKLAAYPQDGPGDTSLDERGYFQLLPDESKDLGVDHKRLSIDSNYSINAGLALIGRKMGAAERLGVAPKGSTYFWKLTKLNHSLGSKATQKVVEAARDAGQAGSWEALEKFSLDNEQKLLHETKHSPKKWFLFVDDVYKTGQPYGFGV